MTNLEALKAEIEPFTTGANTYLRALEKVGLTSSGTATATDTSNETLLATAAVDVLSKLLVLSSESEGGFSQGYSTDAIKRRIKQLIDQYDLDASLLSMSPGVNNATSRW